MSDKYIEKTFLYLLVFSLVLHAAAFILLLALPQEKKPPKQEPYMVELRDLPEPKPAAPAPAEKEVRRLAEQKRRVQRETAPKGERERDKLASVPPRIVRPVPVEPRTLPPQRRVPQPPQQQAAPAEPRRPVESQGGAAQRREPPPAKPRKERVPDLAKLMPTARNMAKLEETYRKKYGPEVEEGETRFLNTDDIVFGSFLRRFENAVYGVWRYPSEAVRLGIEGTTPVRITFNRSGVIVKVEVLETSGSRILDDEVVRTLRQLGPVGGFPKGYDKETFNLVAFFQYGLISGSRRIH